MLKYPIYITVKFWKAYIHFINYNIYLRISKTFREEL